MVTKISFVKLINAANTVRKYAFCNITRILAHLQLNEYPHGTSQCDLSMHRKFGLIILKTEGVVHGHTDRQTDTVHIYI